jgi:F-type H+-transporting ATPase subunit b
MDVFTSIFTNAEVWIFIALIVVVIILLRAGVHSMAGSALDDVGAKVQAQLDEAARLRKEAEDLLAEIKAKRAASEQAAVELLKTAQEDADKLRAEAAEKLEEDIARREAQAERKIALAEAQAAADVRAAAADLAAQTAEAVLAARVKGAGKDPSIDVGLAGLSAFNVS